MIPILKLDEKKQKGKAYILETDRKSLIENKMDVEEIR